MLRTLVVSMLTLGLIMAAGACTKAPAPPLPVSTIGQLAEAGQGVFDSRCVRCHGTNGQGANAPAIIGSNANLGKYGTAQGLFDFIAKVMPANAPGSLTVQEYQQVLCLLLVQNQFAASGTAFDPSQLANISLKK